MSAAVAPVPADSRGRRSPVRTRLPSVPLLWRVFAANAAMLTLAFVALVVAPVTVSAPVAASELVVLAGGLFALILVNLALLRPAFRPLHELAETMRCHDPLSPGRRAPIPGDPALAALAQAFNEMIERLELERRDSARKALAVQEAERRRIARELHDEVGQTLTGVMLQVEGLAAVVPHAGRAPLEELRETARHGTEEVRRIARRLRPEALDELGLHSAMAALVTAIAEQARIPIDRRVQGDLPLSEDEELVVYRIAQEALTNVVRHAGASRAELELRCRDGWTTLMVRDDGRGLAPGSLSSSNGIRGMRERAMLIGADFSVHSPGHGGTEVRLSIPPTS